MKVSVAAAWTVFFVAGLANAQTDFRTGPYTVSGRVLSPTFNHDTEVEIRLMTEGEMTIATARTRTQDVFQFRGLPYGTYYVEVEAAGLQKTRQRVEFIGPQREANITLMPDSQVEFAFRGPADYTAENDVVDVKDITRSPAVDKQFQEALKKLQKGDLNGALSRLESLLARAPDFYDAHKTLGMAYQQSGRYAEAEAQFRLARNLRPVSPTPLIHLGSLYLEQAGDEKTSDTPRQDLLDKAKDVLQRSVELSPAAGFARYLLGVAYYRLGAYSDAENTLIRALDLEPDLAHIRLALANVYIRLQDWSNALTNLDTYLKDNPRSANRPTVLSMRARVAAIANNSQKTQAKQ